MINGDEGLPVRTRRISATESQSYCANVKVDEIMRRIYHWGKPSLPR